jgi:hypothetical protein
MNTIVFAGVLENCTGVNKGDSFNHSHGLGSAHPPIRNLWRQSSGNTTSPGTHASELSAADHRASVDEPEFSDAGRSISDDVKELREGSMTYLDRPGGLGASPG